MPTPAVSIFKSISLTATQTGLTGFGSLTITTNVPTSTITATYSTSPTQVKVNTTAQFYFSQSLFAGTPLANQTAFQTSWNHTFVTVTAFNGTLPNPPTPSSANIQIGFVAVPSQPGTDFVTVLDSIPRLAGLDWTR
ncbi:MAG: hypothetical protein AUI95_00585 [Crenarchaeota archaeon 13_1_40CM_3_52_4]|nr:MAG: hypothetical protein AUI95_00585 [Crenarchaeota archaeon 13_1_40CM_3_52_4]